MMDYLLLYKLGAIIILMLAQLGSPCVHQQDIRASVMVINATRMTYEIAKPYYSSFQNISDCLEKLRYERRIGDLTRFTFTNMTITNATQFGKPFNLTIAR